MNENGNVTNTQGGDLSNAMNLISGYQKKQTEGKRKTSEEILAKYFVPRKTKETFRILPPKQGRKHIEEAFFHVVSTNGKGGTKKHGTVIYCPQHNDPKIKKVVDGVVQLDGNGNPIMIPAPCPLCLKAKKMLAKQDPSLKGKKKENLNSAELVIYENNKKIFTEANKWEAKKFYIVRGIDKGLAKDGVKFWRFKHNYKNQGTLDKLLPILEDFLTQYQVDFADPKFGTDLGITMADSEFNGHTYKTISAISSRGKSALHEDITMVNQWLQDDITWRDVFLPKKAPHITTTEYLEMVANGTNPYWDDTDSTNKHWVFPGRPDLEALANTRTQNLDSNDDEFEYASDVIDDEFPRVTINNITPDKVGTYKDDAVNVGQAVTNQAPPTIPQARPSQPPLVEDNQNTDGDNNYDDLPF